MTIRMNLGASGYDICVENGRLNRIGEFMNLNRRALIVTDSGVPREYAESVKAQCKTPIVVTVPKGEASKNAENYLMLLKTMLQNGFDRGDCVISVGGGVVGDLSGFAAASYMRGIDFYNIPTTLLSQVDSSIGGKTAIDFLGVKNIVGAYYQPNAVLIDSDVLKTLSPRQFACGMAEVIKMAAIADSDLFAYLENGNGDIEKIIVSSLNIKKKVVEQDEKESGIRKTLNFGHTLGHGIEVEQSGSLFHGECVALGTLMMSGKDVKNRLEGLYKKYNLPTAFSGDADRVMNAVLHDKKASGNTITAVVVNEIGKSELRKMTVEEIKDRLITFMGESV